MHTSLQDEVNAKDGIHSEKGTTKGDNNIRELFFTE